MESALRYNAGKPKYSLLHLESLEPAVRVLEYGALKYAPYNWQKGLKVTEIIDSLMRHLTAFQNGENLDPESGLDHVGHMQCNLMFLAYMMKHKPEYDDRHGAGEPLLQSGPVTDSGKVANISGSITFQGPIPVSIGWEYGKWPGDKGPSTGTAKYDSCQHYGGSVFQCKSVQEPDSSTGKPS